MRIRKILLIMTAFILFGFAVLFCWSAKEDANRTYLLLSDPIDAARAEDIFTRESALMDGLGFCFWGEIGNQWVFCKETGAVTEVTPILLSGNPGLLDAGILAWQEGCFLDETTAQTLFGTADCSEQIIWYHDRPYRVLDTVSATQPTMLKAAETSDGFVLNRCVLNVPVETGKLAAQQFLLRWGLDGEVIDYCPLWILVYDSLFILPVILVFQIYFYGRSLTQNRGKRRVMLLAVVFLIILIGSKIRVLPNMVPSRWSDFSFWGNWWDAQRKNFQLVLHTPMGGHHLQMMMNMVKSILSSTAASLLVLWNQGRQKHADTAD